MIKELDEKTKARVFDKLRELVEDIDLRCVDTLMEEGVLAGDIFTTSERVKWRYIREHVESRIEKRFKLTTGDELKKEED